MCASQGTNVRGAAPLRRLALISLMSIPITAELVFGELLFAAHVIFLVETLGFGWGLLTFTAGWAVLGLLVLTAKDSLWPRIDAARARARRRLSDAWQRAGLRGAVTLLGAAALSATAALTFAFAGGKIAGWLTDHPADVAAFLAVAAVVFALLLLMAGAGRSLERWVRRAAATAGPLTRSLATLAAMATLGPALAWLLFRILGHSGRSTYTLTLASAPLFAVVWVPFYGLGVWSLVRGAA